MLICPVSLSATGIQSFTWRAQKYVFDKNTLSFSPSRFVYRVPVNRFMELYSGGVPTENSRQAKEDAFGHNMIDVPVKNYFELLVDEILHPFFVFQIAAVLLWYYDNYAVYATTILVLALTSAIASLLETRQNMVRLSKMAMHQDTVSVLRKDATGREVFVSELSSKLVPGDIISFRENMKVPCDVLVLHGECVVDESQLTGESTPVMRSPMPRSETSILSMENHKKFLMFSGTTILQTRPLDGQPLCTGIVVRTGFSTLKGQLIRAIMFPRPHSFQFYRDAFAFIGVLGVIAIIGFFISLYWLLDADTPTEAIVVRALDVIVIAVPPALPLGLAISTVFALNRLKKRKVFCISPARLNMAGKTSLVVFDKTGTLTLERLEFDTFVPVCDGSLLASDATKDMQILSDDFRKSVICCHSVTELRGELIGDPLDLIIFRQTKWHLSPAGTVNDHTILSSFAEDAVSGSHASLALGVVRRFEFSSETQRMAVIRKDLSPGSTYRIAVKGSPEILTTLCAASSIPASLAETLRVYASQGLRVIAYAGRDLGVGVDHASVMSATRESLEKDLLFYGLVVLVNPVKPDTPEVIGLIRDANIRTVMATGDNVFTAVSVARQCNIVPKNLTVYVAEPRIMSHPKGRGRSKSAADRRETEEPMVTWTPMEADRAKHDPSGVSFPLKSSSQLSAAPVDDWRLCPNDCEFAMTGETFSVLEQSMSKDDIRVLLMRTHIMARMSPANKTRLVELFQDLGYTVAMCGDGANDCGALKQAHFGVSLSEAEASIAAPFTSTDPSIRCVVDVIREGRASLATSFQLFKFMALYSVIQLTSVVLLYHVHDNLGDWQFLYIDLFLVIPITVFMGRTEAARKLVRHRPSGKLLSSMVLFAFFFQFFLQLGYQVFIFFDVRAQSFYAYYDATVEDKEIQSMENTAIFLLSNFLYVFCGVSLSISKPFRRALYTNGWYSISLIVVLAANAFLLLYNSNDDLNDFMQLIGEVPLSYRIRIGVLSLSHVLVAFGFERILVVPSVKRFFKKLLSCSCMRKPRQRKLYKHLSESRYSISSV
jgi:cation-transporting ATPase 13A3/4/5